MRKFLQGYLFLSIISLLFVFPVADTRSQTEEQIKELKKADLSFISGDYTEALKGYLPLLEALDEAMVISYNLNYKIGFTYYASAPEDSFAVPYFRKYLESSEVHFEAYYFLGNISATHHEFDSAIFHFRKFKEFVENNTELSNAGLSEQIIEIAEKQIAKCEYGKFLVQYPGCAKVELLSGGINTIYSEYGPVINPEESHLVFTRRSPETLGGRISEDGDFFEDIFDSKISRVTLPAQMDSFGNPIGEATIENQLFAAPINRGQSVNTEGHEGAIQFSSDGNKLYIYRKSNIWVSEMNKKQTEYLTKNWKKAKRQKQIKGVLRPKTFEPSVSISADGNTIFFSSERAGGFGGLDIYKSERGSDGKWGSPVNLGETINTVSDEDAPFIAADGRTLYFSSRNHSNMGDYDIFISEFTGDSWTLPLNLGYPVNSASDDIFYTVSTLSGNGYFSSNRFGGSGLMDIYKASFPANTSSNAKLIGKIISNDSLPVATAFDLAENSGNSFPIQVLTDSSTGIFSVNLKFGTTYYITTKNENFEPYTDTVTVPEHKYFCQQFIDTMDIILIKILKDTLPMTDSLAITDSLARLGADSAAIADSLSKLELAETLKKIIKVEKKPMPGESHDRKGIVFRVQVGAYKNPLSKNIYDQIPELKSLSFEDGYTRYFSGSFSSIQEARIRRDEIVKLGFSDAFIVAFKDGQKIPLNEALRK